jgi:hypothetical protein
MVMASGFWTDGILPAEYLKKGATMTARYYTSHLDKVRQTLVSKWQGNQSKGVLFLQDNASSHDSHHTATVG